MGQHHRQSKSLLKRLLGLALLGGVFVLTGCQVQLYGGLTEKEANEMMGLLLQHGISCKKEPGQEQTFTLLVNKQAVPNALELLHREGYPRPKFKSMGEVFKREGMVSSPMEDRVRFIYALSQEIAETLTHIDGVVAARVHIVLPENNPLQERTIPSAASVFIKHRASLDLALSAPRIKALVANSIEGLSPDRVTLVLMESQAGEILGGRSLSSASSQGSSGFLAIIGGGIFVAGLAFGGGMGVWLVKKRLDSKHSDIVPSAK